MFNINIYEHIHGMYFLHYNIIQWASEESQLSYEVCLPLKVYSLSKVMILTSENYKYEHYDL